MVSNRASQYARIQDAFGREYEDKSLYSEDNLSSSSLEEELQEGPVSTEEGFVGMMNNGTREVVDQRDGTFRNPPSAPNQTNNTGHLPEERPDGVTAAFEQFQQHEQAQFGRSRNHTSGSNTAASVPSYEQPDYARQQAPTAYEKHASNRYRPSARNGSTSNPRYEALNYGEDISPYPAFRNRDSGISRATGGTDGHHASNSYQPPRQQITWNQNNAYGGAYGDRYTDQANSTNAYQQSPYLLPGQEPHDVNNPPPIFQTRPPTLHGAHALPSSRQGFSTTEIAMNARPQSTSTHTGEVNYPLQPGDAEEGSTKLSRKQTNKKKKGPPNQKCATLKKIIHKQGETVVMNGQLMWSDPNEPEGQKWKPAVVMDDIRNHILRQQNKEAEALGCSYLYPDEPGGEPYSETAFYFPHRHLGEVRNARPDILFAIDETETNNPQPSYDPGWMMYDPVKKEISNSGTLIVLNPADNPIVNWMEIPLCISPHMDGSKMEYMRRVNKSIRQRDIWSRMPRWYWQKPGDPQTRRKISAENTMVNMPSKRFRQKAGCLTWTDRGGSDELEMGLKELLNGTAVGRQCIAANSMRGFGRDLNGVEQLQVKRGNADGKYLNKAGSRAIDEQTRNERREKEDKRIAKAQRAGDLPMPVPSAPSLPAIPSRTGAESQPAESRKRGRSDDEENSDVSETEVLIQRRPHKRNRQTRQEDSRPTDDDDLAMFEQPRLIIEESGLAQRYQLRDSAREEFIYGEGGEESSEDSLFGEGEDDLDEGNPRAKAESEDDNDLYTPDDVPGPANVRENAHNEDVEEMDGNDGDEGEEEEEGHEDYESNEPETATPYPAPEDPYHQPPCADNAEAGLSDLEGHRRWVREMLYEDQETYASSLERRRTAQPSPHYPNAINPLNAPDATTSETDYSEVPPSNNREVASLAVALCPTKKMFWEWTGQTVPQPDREKSYGDQFRELHKAFEEWWSNNAEGPLPILAGMTHWGSSVDDWKPVEKDGVYYEAYKTGHRAPRDKFGRIIDVPGPLLEKFADLI